MFNFSTIAFALLGGILPALLWLFFWLREDSLHPEPLWLIFKTFIGGSIAVILVLPFQKGVDMLFPGSGMVAFGLWAILEESFKFFAAYFIAIKTLDDNEPLDAMMYMIAAALGFVALENALFIFNPLLQEDILGGVLTGNLRFIGASLLHIVSSSTIGTALALNYYKPRKERVFWGLVAFCIAVPIHTAFNLFIINQNNLGTFLTFATVWAGITILMIIFEKVKSMTPPKKVEPEVSTEIPSPTL